METEGRSYSFRGEKKRKRKEKKKRSRKRTTDEAPGLIPKLWIHRTN
jgi:hypothetical protein